VRKVDEEVVHYNIRYATTSQSTVLYKVFGKIREWMEWEAGDQKTKFVPLRLTVHGAAGTGKSFIINTILSYMRCIFYDNDVFHVVAPTGMTTSKVLGETLHRFEGLDGEITEKLQNTVAIPVHIILMETEIFLVAINVGNNNL
jgi:hypothetical protein